MMRRPQFSLKTLLWLILVAAVFLGGMRFGELIGERREKERRLQEERLLAIIASYHEHMSTAMQDVIQRLRQSETRAEPMPGERLDAQE